MSISKETHKNTKIVFCHKLMHSVSKAAFMKNEEERRHKANAKKEIFFDVCDSLLDRVNIKGNKI